MTLIEKDRQYLWHPYTIWSRACRMYGIVFSGRLSSGNHSIASHLCVSIIWGSPDHREHVKKKSTLSSYPTRGITCEQVRFFISTSIPASSFASRIIAWIGNSHDSTCPAGTLQFPSQYPVLKRRARSTLFSRMRKRWTAGIIVCFIEFWRDFRIHSNYYVILFQSCSCILRWKL